MLNATASNLHDYWASAFNAYGKIAYPLTKMTDVQKHAADIMKEYPRSAFATELKETSKKAWSDMTTQLAKDFAYTLKEGGTTTADYKVQGLVQIKR